MELHTWQRFAIQYHKHFRIMPNPFTSSLIYLTVTHHVKLNMQIFSLYWHVRSPGTLSFGAIMIRARANFPQTIFLC